MSAKLSRLTALAALLSCWSSAALPASLTCETVPITVETDSDDLAQRICRVAERAIAANTACNVPLTRPIEIATLESLSANCIGLYHCGEDRIEVLTPEAMTALRDRTGLFSALPDDIYYDSVIAHELVHAAYDAVPCPFDACIATSEYLSYALQIRSLPTDLRADLEAAADLNRRVARDELNMMFLFMAPNKFAAKAWTHFSQRPDPCAYAGQIMNGSIFFDFEHP